MKKLIFKIRKKMAIKKLVKKREKLFKLIMATEDFGERIVYFSRLECLHNEIYTIAHTPYRLPEKGGITVGVNDN